jgi:hypothetical protein
VDPPLPLDRPGREGVRRPRRDHADQRRDGGPRDRRRRRPPPGRPPVRPRNYVEKFRALAAGVLADAEIERFLGLAERLPELTPAEVRELTIVAAPGVLDAVEAPRGLFELGAAGAAAPVQQGAR